MFDQELAIKRAGDKPELAHELMVMLQRELPSQRRLLTEAWQRRDRGQVEKVVHKINGGTRYCGVPALQHYADQLESALIADSGDMESLYEELLRQIDALIATDIDTLFAPCV